MNKIKRVKNALSVPSIILSDYSLNSITLFKKLRQTSVLLFRVKLVCQTPERKVTEKVEH